ncbi:EpsG family protein [Flavobacterium sp. PS2]|uniref:EpsG family protein n=1 Tax=Flavobacterium sp. PS2 TaxID=3384157 RepID=UPI00390CA829
MFFYIFFLLFITGLVLVEYFYPPRGKVIGIIVLILIVLISGLRKGIGYDYNSYVSWYLYKTRDNDLEYGYLAIMNVFRWFNLTPSFLFFFFSFFTCFFVYLGVKKYAINPNIALLFYIIIPGLYLTSFTLVRQSLSVAISFYAFYYLINRKYVIFFLLMFIGVSIHNTCLVPLFLFLLVFKYGDRMKINHLYGMVIFSFLISSFDFFQVFHELFEKSRYAYYFSDKIKPVSIWKIIVLNLEGILILYYSKKFDNRYPYQKYFLVLYCFSIVFINIFSKNYDLTRIFIYFRIFEIIVVANLISLEINTRRIALFLFFYILYFSAFLNGLRVDFEFQKKNMPRLIPYDNILWFSSKIMEPELIKENIFD